MTYTPDLRDFENRVRGQQRSVANRNQVVVGIGSYKLERMNDLMAEINLTRSLAHRGLCCFPMMTLKPANSCRL